MALNVLCGLGAFSSYMNESISNKNHIVHKKDVDDSPNNNLLTLSELKRGSVYIFEYFLTMAM